MDKAELLEALDDSRQEILELLEPLSEEMLLQPGVIGEWSIKDTLAHLSYWEAQIVTLLFQVKNGAKKPGTAHFGKETVDEINDRWYAMGKDRSLEMVWQDWIGVRKQTIRRISEMSEAELSDPKRFSWQRDMPLWEWVVNDSIGHEEEHGDAIREWLDRQDTGSESPGREGSNGNNP